MVLEYHNGVKKEGTGEPIIIPEEIRAIRKRLRLTQAEAGRLIGGGPRAFTKYEAGTLKPSASVVNLLRVLEVHPDTIVSLGGQWPQRRPAHGLLPFEIGGEDIERLTPLNMHKFLLRLLRAEATANDLPMDGIKVSGEINSPDGGEDGRIEWRAGPDRTAFLPARLCQFQAKVGKITSREAAREALKPMVRQVLSSGGCYILCCGKRYAQQDIEKRERAIRDEIRDAGIEISDHQVDFRDADQIADWANCRQPVAMWLKEQTQLGTVGPFRSWDHWAGRIEHAAMPWVQDQRLVELTEWLSERVRRARSVSRVVGPWGIGKSRLTLQALRTRGYFVSETVMYAVESESGAPTINQVVQNLADSGTRAIVVVDQCSPETHRHLEGFVSRNESRLSLITIDGEAPTGDVDETTFVVPEAETSVTEAIINRGAPGLSFEDQRRLVRLAEGFPAVARRVAEVWTTMPVTQAADDDIVRAFVLGRNPVEQGRLLKSARLLAAFGVVRVESGRPRSYATRGGSRIGRSPG